MLDVTPATMPQLVMNYLVAEGYRDAAEHFVQESGTEAKVDLATIEERVAIRKVMMDRRRGGTLSWAIWCVCS